MSWRKQTYFLSNVEAAKDLNPTLPKKKKKVSDKNPHLQMWSVGNGWPLSERSGSLCKENHVHVAFILSWFLDPVQTNG